VIADDHGRDARATSSRRFLRDAAMDAFFGCRLLMFADVR
jgi:hypothetical protein